MKRCQNCGTPFKPEDIFCGECGSEIPRKQITREIHTSSKESVPKIFAFPWCRRIFLIDKNGQLLISGVDENGYFFPVYGIKEKIKEVVVPFEDQNAECIAALTVSGKVFIIKVPLLKKREDGDIRFEVNQSISVKHISFPTQNIISINFEDDKLIALNDTNQLFSCAIDDNFKVTVRSLNQYASCLLEEIEEYFDNSSCHLPELKSIQKRLVKILSAIFFLDEDGNVYVNDSDKEYLLKVLDFKSVKDILFSEDGAIVLHNTQKVTVWDSEKYTDELKRRNIDLPDILMICAGSDFFLALDYKGQIFAWGSDSQNILRLPKNRNIFEPVKLDLGCYSIKQIKSIFVGDSFFVAEDDCGSCIGFGKGDFAPLGIYQDISTPTEFFRFN